MPFDRRDASDAAVPASPFLSFFQGGFECSTHRRRDGRRLDLLASTGHDNAAAADYQTLAGHGIRTVRDGFRWHRIEIAPGRYDWSSVLPMLRAARETGTQVIWDLCHYGWPDHLDIWDPGFVFAFARFVRAAARLVAAEMDTPPLWCPVNEISFWAWAGGEVARFNPMARGRGAELKRQLVRAHIAAVEQVRLVDPRARIVQVDPAIHVVGRSGKPGDRREAECYRLAQFEAMDMVSGRMCPELGGAPECLDIIGVNYYADNQWYIGGRTIEPGAADYRPFQEILAEFHARYDRPLLVAETGAEGDARAPWLHYVAEQVAAAIGGGVPVQGLCLYPVLDYPGWDNDRHCPVGLLGNRDAGGERPVYAPLAEALAGLRPRFEMSGNTVRRATAA